MIKAIETKYKGCRFRSRLEARWAVFFDVLGLPWEYEIQGYVLSDGQSYLPDFYIPQDGLSWWVEIKPVLPSEENRDKFIRLLNDFWQERQYFLGWLICGSPGDEVILKGVFYPDGQRLTQSDNPWWSFDRHEIERAYIAARSARFEHGETPQVIERVVREIVKPKVMILSGMDILVRRHTLEELLTPTPYLLVHLNNGGRPLCAPRDLSKDGGFNVGAWRPVRADVAVDNICRRCLKYSASRARRTP